MNPTDIATAATASFIRSLVSVKSKIIEVGCGAGQVAAELARSGYDIIGIDADGDAIARARLLGVKAIHAEWPDVESGLVDAILFTRSLHHVRDLHAAVAKIPECLSSGGIVLVEDFSIEEIDSAALGWFTNAVKGHDGRALISGEASKFVADLLETDDPLHDWRREHHHELHTATQMISAIEREFEVLAIQRVPYLYRYLIDALPQTVDAAMFAKDIFQQESRFATEGMFIPAGLRIVAARQAAE